MKHFKDKTKKSKIKLKEENKGINKLTISKHQILFFSYGNTKCMLKLSLDELQFFPKYQSVQPQSVTINI
jgi:hypothetical protein